ncbi:Pycsar system effector family protein [Croceibacter atlanticus]|jgi:predicted metal-dependent HD superfamily phosphohydrolase|uniref:Pycsar system effector family protein n=1 Tax=Croceibacter atlanticus TaxID=313588 RepID=UPI002E0D5399|nr:Pycsar system effector family protein [Croceibacter atlanticus]|tara:strand:+ start:129968 stop:131173 length:1206 start_codon:yes stop_codon:yes gene_type:complete
MSEVAEKPSELVQKADEFVLKLFKEKLPNTFLYHNYNHTLRVVKSTKEIIEHSEIHVKDKETLLLSAWLHDTGYVVKVDGHEEESAKFAEAFLKENNADSNLIEKVKKLILATKFDFETSDDLESILKDADASHFAKDYFEETSEFLRQELQLQGIANYTPAEWINENIKVFTEQHKFHTDYALKNWKAQKDQNLLDLLEAKKKKAKKIRKEETKAQLKAKYKNESPERSIQTLYRVTLRNHIKLSDIADTKANILLSVNAIIISLALANIIPKLDSVTNRHLMIPTLILVLFSVASMILSIMSTRPNVTSGEFTKEQVKKREVNILFFGNFHKMAYDQYQWAMNEIINDKNYVYESLTKDLYLLGIVLNRKYRLLRLTYTIFMTGMIISVISFVIAFWSI